MTTHTPMTPRQSPVIPHDPHSLMVPHDTKSPPTVPQDTHFHAPTWAPWFLKAPWSTLDSQEPL